MKLVSLATYGCDLVSRVLRSGRFAADAVDEEPATSRVNEREREPHPCAGPEMVLQTDATGVRVDYVSCDGQPEAEAGWQTTRVGAHVRARS